MDNRITDAVHRYYWQQDYNCARTCLLTLGELFGLPIQPPLFQAAVGLHGAGGFRAQCGLAEGGLLFIGLYFGQAGLPDEQIVPICYRFAQDFTQRFGSLNCFHLRPGGFLPTDPPHRCESLTVDAITFIHDFLQKQTAELCEFHRN